MIWSNGFRYSFWVQVLLRSMITVWRVKSCVIIWYTAFIVIHSHVIIGAALVGAEAPRYWGSWLLANQNNPTLSCSTAGKHSTWISYSRNLVGSWCDLLGIYKACHCSLQVSHLVPLHCHHHLPSSACIWPSAPAGLSPWWLYSGSASRGPNGGYEQKDVIWLCLDFDKEFQCCSADSVDKGFAAEELEVQACMSCYEDGEMTKATIWLTRICVGVDIPQPHITTSTFKRNRELAQCSWVSMFNKDTYWYWHRKG